MFNTLPLARLCLLRCLCEAPKIFFFFFFGRYAQTIYFHVPTLGVAWNLGLPQPIENALLPCNNAVWSFSEAAMGIWSLDDLDFSSSFSIYVSLFTNELWHVHNFLQQSYDMRSTEDRPQAQVDCEAVDARLLQWQAGSGSIAFTSGSSLTPYDPNILMTRCMFNA